jgi:soluble P-type ATPase
MQYSGVTLTVGIPGWRELRLEHLILDVNGTLTNRGGLLSDVHPRVAMLRLSLAVHLVSADTFGTLGSIAEQLEVNAVRASSGEDKLRTLEQLGPERSAVIGNGRNDVLVLEAAALGIAVIGPEGASSAALRAADVVCLSVLDALDLLLEPLALSATLRP